VRLDHINLTVPEDGVDAEAAWLVDLLGYTTVEPGPDVAALGRVHWFEAEDGTQVHLSPDPDHRPSRRAHTAMFVGPGLEALKEKVEASGQETFEIRLDGRRQLFATDPAGNLWEFVDRPDS